MKLSSVGLFVCLSVCLSHHSPARFAAAVGPASRRCRSITARPALSSKCEQCHVSSCRRKLNMDLLFSYTELMCNLIGMNTRTAL